MAAWQVLWDIVGGSVRSCFGGRQKNKKGNKGKNGDAVRARKWGHGGPRGWSKGGEVMQWLGGRLKEKIKKNMVARWGSEGVRVDPGQWCSSTPVAL